MAISIFVSNGDIVNNIPNFSLIEEFLRGFESFIGHIFWQIVGFSMMVYSFKDKLSLKQKEAIKIKVNKVVITFDRIVEPNQLIFGMLFGFLISLFILG